MDNKKKDKLYVFSVTIVFIILTLCSWLKPADISSMTERRNLAQFPELTIKSVGNGKFMSEFENYTVDQFPFRDEFRSIKAFVHKYIFRQSDNNGVYVADDYISKMEYPLSEKAMNRVKNKLDYVYKTYIAGTDANVYYSLIPDKNYFLAEKNGYPAMDYEKLYQQMGDNLNYMTYLDITNLLTIEDFYYTDTHWKQECITDVAKQLASGMGVTLDAEYKTITLDTPFYGVYYGQLGLPIEPDTISYLNHPLFENCKVYDHQNQKEIPIYNMELAKGRDPYEMYLSGSLSVITIENPNATTEKELVIFRDSFTSSIAPLFAEGYAKITLLDIRYLNQNLIGNFVEFDNQDVLFLYSTSVVNNETAF